MTRRELTFTALILVALSAVLYVSDWMIFHRAKEIGFYTLNDIAFLPLQVLFLTLIVDRLLSEREKRNRIYQMNMVIGTFFSSVGRPLLHCLSALSPQNCALYEKLYMRPDWSHKDINEAIRISSAANPAISIDAASLGEIRDFLVSQRDFMLRLLENPILLEHEMFTDLLWASFHLLEELTARHSLEGLPPTDLQHLNLDTERVFVLLLRQWYAYMLHLRSNYPYLFSFAARMDPLRPEAHPEITA